jgi:hypothetical protein
MAGFVSVQPHRGGLACARTDRKGRPYFVLAGAWVTLSEAVLVTGAGPLL